MTVWERERVVTGWAAGGAGTAVVTGELPGAPGIEVAPTGELPGAPEVAGGEPAGIAGRAPTGELPGAPGVA